MARARGRAAVSAGLFAAAVVSVGAARQADANMGLPDSQQILLPPDRPHEIVVGTNFGLLVSEDDGATWQWVCEQIIAPYAREYQQGPAPADRIFAISNTDMMVGGADGCDWQPARGALAAAIAVDDFPDPSDPGHVLALATPFVEAGASKKGLYESHDGGATFAGPLFVGPAGTNLDGVEIARSAPATFYLTLYAYDVPQHPFLARSDDAGLTWQTLDLEPAVGSFVPWLLLVHPTDPRTLYLRIASLPGEKLAIATDGGATVRVVLTLAGQMSAFLRRADGTLLVGMVDGGGYQSSDDGASFQPFADGLHLRALGERAGQLYAVGDNFKDHFAVAVSSDDGATWRRLLGFDDFCSTDRVTLRGCATVQSACGAALEAQRCQFCMPEFCPVAGDGGTSPTPPGGCGCAVGARGGAGGALVALALLLAWRRRRVRALPPSPWQ